MMIDRSPSDNFFCTICTCMFYSTLSKVIALITHILVKLPQIKFDDHKYAELIKLYIKRLFHISKQNFRRLKKWFNLI
jgi:hypothetical protein